MTKDTEVPITPRLEPAVSNNDVFIKRVKDFVKVNDFVYYKNDTLVDKQSIPIFETTPVEYGMVSEVQLANSITFLREGANTIKRLLKIIEKRINNGREK